MRPDERTGFKSPLTKWQRSHKITQVENFNENCGAWYGAPDILRLLGQEHTF